MQIDKLENTGSNRLGVGDDKARAIVDTSRGGIFKFGVVVCPGRAIVESSGKIAVLDEVGACC